MTLLRLTAAACIVAAGFAQTRPEFEVASIKRSRPDTLRRVLTLPGGDLEIRGHSLKDLAAFAWDLPGFQISGGPKWVESETFDISAKPLRPPEADARAALQQLLADRFQLRIHLEKTELPAYALVLSRKDGKPGRSLKQSTQGGCAAAGSPDVSALTERPALDGKGRPALA